MVSVLTKLPIYFGLKLFAYSAGLSLGSVVHLLWVLLISPSLSCRLLNWLLHTSMTVMLILRTTAQLGWASCACVGSALILLEVDLIEWPLVLILIIAVLWVDMFHSQGALELSWAQHGGHITDVVTYAMICHLLFTEHGWVFFPLSLDLWFETLDLLFNFVVCSGTTLRCVTLGGRLCILQFLLHLLCFFIEILERWLGFC